MLSNKEQACFSSCSIPAIVVLYEPTKENILNLKQYANNLDCLLILDNSSSTNITLIKEVLPSVTNINQNTTEPIRKTKYHYLFFGKNLGLCKALNIGVNILKNKYEWILFMDDDSTFATNIVGCYQNFIKNHDTKDIAILAPVHLFDRSKDKISSGIEDISWAMTSGCLYNVKLFSKLGGFDEQLFLDCLDLDFGYKAKRSGFRVIKCKDAGVNHNPAQTNIFNLLGISIKYGVASPERYKLQCQNLFYLVLKYNSLSILKIFMWKWIKAIFFFDRKIEYLKNMSIGTLKGIQRFMRDKQYVFYKGAEK